VYNIYSISIYFCNIHMKHLQHTSETSETLETDACNMCFQSVTSTCCLDENEGSLTPTWRSMLRSDVEIAGVKLVGGTDLGRDRGRWMEREYRQGRCGGGRDLSREQGHALRRRRRRSGRCGRR
jgi:hypothetical protein